MAGPEIPWMAERLYARLPDVVLAGRDHWCLRHHPKSTLGRHKIAQLNRWGWITTMDFDCDYSGAVKILQVPHVPPFSWIVHNHESGHLHVAWLLEIPLNNRRKNLRAMLADVYARMCAWINADPLHHGRGPVPNPLYVGDRHTSIEWGSAAPMRLADFYEWLPETTARLDEPSRPGLPLSGEGRNVDLFQAARRAAYAAACTAQAEGWSPTGFAEHVLRLTRDVNREFSQPLPDREILATARSVARYAWRHRARLAQTGRTLAQRQAARGRRSGQARRTRTQDRDKRIRQMHRKGAAKAAIARAVGISPRAVAKVLARPRRAS